MKLVKSKPLKRGGKGAVSVFYHFLTPMKFPLVFYIFLYFYFIFYFILFIFFWGGVGVGGGQSESMGVD